MFLPHYFLQGRNIEENQYVKMGAYHTLSLELQRKFTLTKENWDAIALDRVEEACDSGKFRTIWFENVANCDTLFI